MLKGRQAWTMGRPARRISANGLDAICLMVHIPCHKLPSIVHHMHGAAIVDPLVDEPGGIAAVQGDADAAMGGGIIGDGGEAVDEDVAVDLHAPWHGRIVEEL